MSSAGGDSRERGTSGAGEGILPERGRPFVLAATILASAMAFIDGSVVNIALPALQTDLGTGFAAVQWVVTAYLLMLGGLILIGGAAGDRFGRRRVFAIGIATFGAASLACALAPGAGVLIGARAVQGAGAALLVPQSLAIITAVYPRDERGRAIGTWAGASAITTAMGPPLGGLLIDAFGWRSVFAVNLPLSACALWLTWAHVPESRAERAAGPLDWTGGALGIAAFGLLTAGLTRFTETPQPGAAAWALLGLGAAGVGLFVLVEARAADPLVPLSLFSDRVFAGANVMTLFLYGALSGVLFLLPFDLVQRRGLSATQVGLTLLPLGVVIGTLSRSAGDWAARHGPRTPLAAGSVLVGVAAAGLARGAPGFWTGVLAPVLLLSFGMAIVVAPLTTAVMNAAPEGRSGAASGVNNAASRLAGLFAVAIVGAVASVVFTGALEAAGLATEERRFGLLPGSDDPHRAPLEAAFVRAYGVALGATAAGCAMAALVARRLIPARPPDGPQKA